MMLINAQCGIVGLAWQMPKTKQILCHLILDIFVTLVTWENPECHTNVNVKHLLLYGP